MNEIIVPEQEETKNEMTVVEQLPDYAILNPEIPMSAKVEVATNVANTLAPLVREQGLAIKGLNKKNPEAEYVMVEGWEVLGTILGIVPVTTIIEDIKNKHEHTVGYRARATLYQNPIIKNDEIVGGTVIARAEAQADKSGRQKAMFAIASMAQTRALGKSYRMGLSWIMKMAGFEGTPAEEMPRFSERDVLEAKATAKINQKSKPKKEEATVVEAELVEEDVPIREQKAQQAHQYYSTNNNGFETADQIEPTDTKPVIENYTRSVAKQVHFQGIKVNQKNMISKAKEMNRRKEIPDEYMEELLSFIKLNCPGDNK